MADLLVKIGMLAHLSVFLYSRSADKRKRVEKCATDRWPVIIVCCPLANPFGEPNVAF
jgi:hypothetical protein